MLFYVPPSQRAAMLPGLLARYYAGLAKRGGLPQGGGPRLSLPLERKPAWASVAPRFLSGDPTITYHPAAAGLNQRDPTVVRVDNGMGFLPLLLPLIGVAGSLLPSLLPDKKAKAEQKSAEKVAKKQAKAQAEATSAAKKIAKVQAAAQVAVAKLEAKTAAAQAAAAKAAAAKGKGIPWWVWPIAAGGGLLLLGGGFLALGRRKTEWSQPPV